MKSVALWSVHQKARYDGTLGYFVPDFGLNRLNRQLIDILSHM